MLTLTLIFIWYEVGQCGLSVPSAEGEMYLWVSSEARDWQGDR
jgi:hypothetical protein